MKPVTTGDFLADLRASLAAASRADLARRTRCLVCQAMTADIDRHHRLHGTEETPMTEPTDDQVPNRWSLSFKSTPEERYDLDISGTAMSLLAEVDGIEATYVGGGTDGVTADNEFVVAGTRRDVERAVDHLSKALDRVVEARHAPAALLDGEDDDELPFVPLTPAQQMHDAERDALRVADVTYGDGPWDVDRPDVILLRDEVTILARAVAKIARLTFPLVDVTPLPAEPNDVADRDATTLVLIALHERLRRGIKALVAQAQTLPEGDPERVRLLGKADGMVVAAGYVGEDLVR